MHLAQVDSSGVIALLAALLASVLDLVGEYHEMTAHSEVVLAVDPGLAETWSKLWKWTIGMMVGLIVSTFLAFLLSVVGLLLMLAASVGGIVVEILKLYYLHRTARAFQMVGGTLPPAAR